MSNKEVTIVIPTFNRKNYLLGAVNSALNQTRACEVIVVDHGSSDGTKQLAKSFPAEVRYLRREKDLGPHFAWLDGVLESETEFVKLLFDDDLLHPGFIEKSLAMMRSEVGFVFTAARSIDRDTGEKIASFFDDTGNPSGVFPVRSRFGGQVEGWMLSPALMLGRREDVVDALYQGSLPFKGPKYKGVGPDHYMKLLAFLRYRQFGYISDPLVDFGSHPGSITMRAEKDEVRNRLLWDSYAEVFFFYKALRLIKPIFAVRSILLPSNVTSLFQRISRTKSKAWFRKRIPY